MTQLLLAVLKFCFNALLVVLCIVAAFALPFVIATIVQFLLAVHRGKKPPLRLFPSVFYKHGILYRLFVDFPQRVVDDFFNSNPDAFPYSGVVMICGEQGAGKTVTAAYILLALRKLYPAVKILSNTPIKFADGTSAGEISSPDDIIFNDNGIYGTVKLLDEIQNWFNSAESQYFPPEMLSEISQQRKQRSLFFGTSQRFDRISKAIRQQTHYIVLPMTILGALTFVRVYKPDINDDGLVVKKRCIKTFFFVQTEELRNCFDTYEKIKRLSVKGWKSTTEQYRDNGSNVDVNIDIRDKSHKK